MAHLGDCVAKAFGIDNKKNSQSIVARLNLQQTPS
jgi:hypothetical protein